MKTYLSVDFGLKRVGLAVSRLWLAEPLKTVDIAVADKEISKVVLDEHIDVVLVGISDGEIAQKAREFAQVLRKILPVPVEEIDETLSTKESDALVIQSGMSKEKRKGPRDHFAAAVFLQEYLDTHKED